MEEYIAFEAVAGTVTAGALDEVLDAAARLETVATHWPW
jgi:hypothetical protein